MSGRDSMAGPKRHHIIPRIFLERYCRDGLLYVYDRERNAFRGQAPINTAVMREYYTILASTGQKDLRIEAALPTLEGETKPVLERLEQREAIRDNERATLAFYRRGFAILDVVSMRSS